MANGQLTPIQQATVEIAARLPIPSPSAVAEERGVSRQTVHEILTRPNVASALQKARAEGSDRARSSLAAAVKTMHRCTSRMETAIEEANLEQAAVIFKALVETIPRFEAYLDNKHAEERDVPMLAEVERAALERGVRLGEYLERRRNRAPQHVVVKADSRADNPPATLADPT